MSLATMSSQTSKPPQALRFLHEKFKHILLSSHTSQNTAKLPNVCLITVKVSEKKKNCQMLEKKPTDSQLPAPHRNT